MLISPQLENSIECLLRLMPALQTQGRFVSMYRKKCDKTKPPRCSKENIKKSACLKRTIEEAKTESPFKKFFVFPECCPDPCPVFPPFDDLYYIPSDKAKRKYEQTWVECPDIKIKPREMCCFEKLDYPKMAKRKIKPNTACVVKCQQGKGKCIKVVLSGCRKVRDPPNCLTLRKPLDCHKKCTPYPAYSECERPKGKALRPIECNCLKIVAMCDVLRAWRKMKGLN